MKTWPISDKVAKQMNRLAVYENAMQAFAHAEIPGEVLALSGKSRAVALRAWDMVCEEHPSLKNRELRYLAQSKAVALVHEYNEFQQSPLPEEAE